ncbi:MAG: terminase small subunit [Janthinobacterium lividum]
MSTTPENPTSIKLDAKHQRFVSVFCVDPSLNATRAAIAAGYSAKTAAQQASRLLRNVKVRDAIETTLAKAAMGTEEIAAQWSTLGRVNLSDFFTKVEYEEATKVQRPLAESIATLEQAIGFDEEYAARAVELLALAGEAKTDYLGKSQAAINKKRLRVLELQMQLERDPTATYEVTGPPIKKYRMELDLVKADELGVLDLAKSIKPTQHGIAIELPDRLAALERLAKWQGMFVDKVEHSGSMGLVWEETKTYEGKGPEVA